MQQEGVDCDFFSSESWVILSPIEQSIKRKIEAVGTPLKDWDIQINYGIKTGLNDAFIINTEKRDEILANCLTEDERARTAELIRPILRGRDIKRYGYNWANLWLINIHNGIKGKLPRIDINEYPAIKVHLDQYWNKIKDRMDQGDTPYNLRNCAYMDENAHPEKLDTAPKLPPFVGPRFSHFVLVLGVGGLLFVPIFKAVTGLPPYLGMLISLGVLWVFTELVYDHKQNMEESIKNRVSKVLKHIDMPTILFFLGILMSVAALQSAGLLTDFADFLDKNVHEVYTIAGITGLLSAVIDNVPLVAACMGMYPVVDTAALASSLDPVYMQAFVQDGIFWHLLTFCAGVGGSLLIIGSAAGVVAMGLEKIEFGWYLRKITLLALAGYFAGMLVIFLEHLLLG